MYWGQRYNPQPAWRDHICGLYYVIPCHGYLQKTYLPQVELQAHASILSTTSRTVLTQTFLNPSTEKGIKEVRYTFPLYDGVSVVGFTCHVGDRTIIGEVKEKEKARAVFKEAVARGETAGLFEQLPEASDVFTTTVGNIPPGARVIIKITYLGELKHDMEVDGIRFTIPTHICPRYGDYPGTLLKTTATEAQGSKISITVDAEMADGSFIQKIQSPSHPVAITMGTTTFAPNADPTMSKASATLTSGSAQLDTDFVLQVIAKNTGVPKAVLENHPTIPNHRALMATLVPKFALPAEKPEIVFVCDRSGSMAGSRMTLAAQALKVFLKSLPVGVKFNICSFGSRHSFLWKKSVTYSQQTLDEAVQHAESFSANYGGTEMLAPLKATIEKRYKDMPLEVMMLTDGEVWDQSALFDYLNKSVNESKAPIRIFTLGIGNGVSHALIEGMAKAGNGFSQTVGEGEKMDMKVVRMLKGALSPHVNDYTLEVKYKNNAATPEEDDDFEIVEKVADSLKMKLDLSDMKEEKEKKPVGFQSKTFRAFFTNPLQKKPISLFDTSVDPDKEDPPAYDETGEERYAHLPKVPLPKILQAPQNIPPLFAFNRTTVYLLLGPDAPQGTPKSVVLRGTSAHGPLELEIPIEILELPGETIHQLAAKKAISELEQGRGWLPETKDESGKLIKAKFEGRFDDMVEREAVRLGVQFQVGGKWCSFVAVESNRKNQKGKDGEATPEWEWLEDEAPEPEKTRPSTRGGGSRGRGGGRGKRTFDLIATEQRKNTLANTKDSGGDMQMLGAPSPRSAKRKESVDERRRSSRGKYYFEADSEDDEEVDGTFPAIRPSRLFVMDIDHLNGQHIERIISKTDKVDDQVALNRARLDRISGGPQHDKSASNGSDAHIQPHLAKFDKVDDDTIARNRDRLTRISGSPQYDMFAGNPPPPGSAPAQGNHALQDHQMGLMLLEQQNKKRLLMARQDQDALAGVMERGEKLDSLNGRSSNLAASATAFRKSAAKPQSRGGVFGGFGGGLFGSRSAASPASPPPAPSTSSSAFASFSPAPPSDGLFGSTQQQLEMQRQQQVQQSAPSGNLFGMNQQQAMQQQQQQQQMQQQQQQSVSTFGAAPPPPPPAPGGPPPAVFGNSSAYGGPPTHDFSGAGAVSPSYSPVAPPTSSRSPTPPRASKLFAAQAPILRSKTPEDLVDHLISLQTFEGSWEWNDNLLATLVASLSLNQALIMQEANASSNKKHLATSLVIAVFEEKLAAFRGSWELVVDKARDWLEGEMLEIEDIMQTARKLVL